MAASIVPAHYPSGHELSRVLDGADVFDAVGDTGLTHAWIMIAVGFAATLGFGSLVTRHFDRKGACND
jgi:hypothetical protein